MVRPFGWKGDTPTVRPFVSGPAIGGLGMQPEELLWKDPKTAEDPDPDGDGVERELSVGDVTAMTIYTAAQETPGEVERLAAAGLVAAPTAEDTARIAAGRAAFASIGCATCHTPEMRLESTVFEEPTLRGNGNYYDATLAAPRPRLRSGEAVQVRSAHGGRSAPPRGASRRRSDRPSVRRSQAPSHGPAPRRSRPETPSRARPTPTP